MNIIVNNKQSHIGFFMERNQEQDLYKQQLVASGVYVMDKALDFTPEVLMVYNDEGGVFFKVQDNKATLMNQQERRAQLQQFTTEAHIPENQRREKRYIWDEEDCEPVDVANAKLGDIMVCNDQTYLILEMGDRIGLWDIQQSKQHTLTRAIFEELKVYNPTFLTLKLSKRIAY